MRVIMKLVRDKIPQIIENANQSQFYHIEICKSKEEYMKYLALKIKEEASELAAKPTSLEEMADVLEVLRYLAGQSNYSIEDVIKCGLEKNKKNGSFKKGYILKLLDEERL